MAVTTGRSGVPAGAGWQLLLRPRWLAWHSFVLVATVGMFLLGDWQLHRAESGNELSWAYTFEWPLFAAFTVFFWIKSLRDELREHSAAAAGESQSRAAEFTVAGAGDARSSAAGFAGPSDPSAAVTGAQESAGGTLAGTTDGPAGTTDGPAGTTEGAAGTAGTRPDDGGVETARRAGVGRPASWDATSWDATNWAATGQQAGGADDSGNPVDVARATPADGDAYVARLMAEVQRGGRRGGRR